MSKLYRGATPPPVRIAMFIPESELKAVDEWGIPAGMPSRTAAIRNLLRIGLEAQKQEAAEKTS